MIKKHPGNYKDERETVDEKVLMSRFSPRLQWRDALATHLFSGGSVTSLLRLNGA